MKESKTGWVVINIGHPSTGGKYIVHQTFAYYKKDAIKSFIDGSGNTWKFWKDKYNFRAVKAKQTVELLTNQIK